MTADLSHKKKKLFKGIEKTLAFSKGLIYFNLKNNSLLN